MSKALKIAVILAFSCLSWSAFSQKDFGAWIGVDFRVPLLKKLDVGLEAQSRFESNVSQVDQSFISPYVKYDLHKFIELGVDYRLSNSSTGAGFFGNLFTHRTSLDVEFKDLLELFVKKTPLNVSARLRGTHEVERGDLNNDNIRGRIKLAYNLPGTKLEPHILGEVFYHFNDQITYTFSGVEAKNRFNKYRLRGGLNYPVKKRHAVKLYFIYESRFESPRADFVLGVGYSYKLKRLFK